LGKLEFADLQVVVGFDGVNSIIGSWLGFEKPKKIKQLEIRRMANFPNCHNFPKMFYIFLGRTVYLAILPMTLTKSILVDLD
jgi:flavin-dependent dehydrogenase